MMIGRLEHPSHPPFKAIGGYYHAEAIMILRRFYVTENTNGQSTPNPYPSHLQFKDRNSSHPQIEG
jgi:hypothetical protein